jgi:DNA-binding NarL/FixJ family response regulator
MINAPEDGAPFRDLDKDAIGWQPSVTEELEHGVTQREIDVLTLIVHGLSNAEVAAHLTLSAATVKTHIGRLLMKLHARDRAQLMIVAYETNLVQPRSTPRSQTT